jgi:neutral ceramidase
VLSFARIGRRVTAAFVAAHPGNDLRRGGTYLSVERREPAAGDGGTWTRVADDNDWSTAFRWTRTGRTASTATVTWTIPDRPVPGTYRLRYHGDSTATGPFTGTTEPFDVR